MGEAARISLLVLSILILAGGIFGFVKGKSKASLIAGSISSVLLIVCFALALTNLQAGLTAGMLVCLFLTGLFGSRLAKTKKFMPSGLLLILCLLVAVLVGLGLMSAPGAVPPA